MSDTRVPPMTTEDSGLFDLCPLCKGSGKIDGFLVDKVCCSYCSGKGVIAAHRKAPQLPSVPDVPTALDAGGVSAKGYIKSCPNCHKGPIFPDTHYCGSCDVEVHYDEITAAPAVVTGEWVVEKNRSGQAYDIRTPNGYLALRLTKTDAGEICKAYGLDLAQVTARAEAAEAKLLEFTSRE